MSNSAVPVGVSAGGVGVLENRWSHLGGCQHWQAYASIVRMIDASISDPFRREPDRTDRPSLVTVSVSVDILPAHAEEVLAALVRTAHDQMLRAVEPPF